MSALLDRLRSLEVDVAIDRSGDLRCRAAAGVLTPELLDEIKAHKSSLIRALRRSRTAAERPAPAAAGLPLTYAQEQIWFEQQLDPGAVAYNLPTAVRLRGPLNVAALIDSLQRIVARHPVLNARIDAGADGCRLIHLDGDAFAPRCVDYSHLDPALAARRAEAWLDAECNAPFDLAAGPFVRAAICRIASGEHILVLNRHHVASDGWSLAIITRELNHFYQAATTGTDAALPALTERYEQYVESVRTRLAGPAGRAQLDYWRSVFANFDADAWGEPPQEPPGDLPPAVRLFDVSLARYRRIQELARAQRLTPFAVLLAVFAYVVGRQQDRRRVLLGTDVSTRDSAQHEMLVGHFVNPVALLIEWDREMTILDYLQHVRAVLAGAMSHKDVPIAWVLRPLRAQHRVRRERVFDVLFGMHNNPHSELRLAPDIDAELLPARNHHALYDLCCYLTDTPAGLAGEITVAQNLGGAAAGATLLADFEALIDRLGVADNLADSPLSTWENDLCGGAASRAAAAAQSQRQRYRQRKDSALARLAGAAAAPVAPVPGLAGATTGGAPGAPLLGAVPARIRRLRESDLVRRSALADAAGPLVYRPEADVDVSGWLESNQPRLLNEINTRGAILLRAFDITADSFPTCTRLLAQQVVDLAEDTSPRSKVGDQVYSSTDYPPERTIRFHNENSYAAVFPAYLFFYCDQAPKEGGQTPLADGREVLRRLDASLVRHFQERGWCYVRNYLPGLGVPWQRAFGTGSRQEVEAYCERFEIDYEWLSDEHLRTTQRRAPIVTHPVTGEPAWFNHITFFNRAMLDPDIQKTLPGLGDGQLPNNTYYGDGAEIETAVLDAIDTAYAEATVQFDWQAGDLLVVDNVLMAHGRRPYRGDRRIRVMMADPVYQD